MVLVRCRHACRQAALCVSAAAIASLRWSERSSQPSGIRKARAAMAVVAALT